MIFSKLLCCILVRTKILMRIICVVHTKLRLYFPFSFFENHRIDSIRTGFEMVFLLHHNYDYYLWSTVQKKPTQCSSKITKTYNISSYCGFFNFKVMIETYVSWYFGWLRAYVRVCSFRLRNIYMCICWTYARLPAFAIFYSFERPLAKKSLIGPAQMFCDGYYYTAHIWWKMFSL